MTTRTFKKQAVGTSDFLRERCLGISARLRTEHASRLRTRQNNLDSGIPLEELFRIELAALLQPYDAEVGRVVAREGFTAGECDVVILNRDLVPTLLPGTADGSRNKWFAVEGTYGIVEVKQTLVLGAVGQDGKLVADPKGTLWDACTKIFSYKQLSRTFSPQIAWGTNAPFGYAFFYDADTRLETAEERDQLLREFIAINALVEPEARVNGLIILDKGAVTWSFLSEASTRTFATLQHPVEAPRPVWLTYHPMAGDTLYWFFTQVWSLLARTQLGAPDLLSDYGGASLKGLDVRAMPVTVAAQAERKPTAG